MFSKQLVLAVFASATAAASGQDLQSSDFPQACRSTCDATMRLFNQCIDQNDGNAGDSNWNWNNWNNNSQFHQCMCQGSNANVDLPNCDSCVRQYPVNSQNGGTNQGNEVQQGMQYCGFQQQNNFGTTSGVILPTPTPTPYIANSFSSSECRTWVYTSTYNNNGNNNNNGIDNIYLATSTQCNNQPGATGAIYGAQTSWITETYQATQNGQVYQQTALVGVGPNGARQTLSPDDAASNGVGGAEGYTGAAPATALPYWAAAGGFLMAAFVL